jgi:hypothetical protein
MKSVLGKRSVRSSDSENDYKDEYDNLEYNINNNNNNNNNQAIAAVEAPPQLYSNVYNALRSEEGYEEPDFYIPELQTIVSSYTGGTCDALTEGGQRCWTQNRRVGSNRYNYNCSSYCLESSHEWLLPILLAMPTQALWQEDDSETAALTVTFPQHRSMITYIAQIADLQHYALDAITVSVYLPANNALGSPILTIRFDGPKDLVASSNKRYNFQMLKPTISETFLELFPNGSVDEIGDWQSLNCFTVLSVPESNRDTFTEEANVDFSAEAVTNNNNNILITDGVKALFQNLIAPALAQSTGCRIEYSIHFPADSHTVFGQMLSQSLQTLSQYNDRQFGWRLWVPEFPEPNARWSLFRNPNTQNDYVVATAAHFTL